MATTNLCIATLKNGNPCTYKKKNGNYCGIHSKMATITNDQPNPEPEKPAESTKSEKIILPPKKDLILEKYNTPETLKKIIQIQRWFLKNMWIQLRGVKHIKQSNNSEELSTCEDIHYIPCNYIYIIEDVEDGNYYTFDIRSLNKMYILHCEDNNKNGKKEPFLNPYNRNKFEEKMIDNMKKYIRLLNSRKIPIYFEQDKLTPEQEFKNEILNLFQDMDKMGNYTNYLWFYELDVLRLQKLYYWCKDIWEYSYQGSKTDRINIAQPDGKVFLTAIHSINCIKNEKTLRSFIFSDVKKLVLSGKTKDDRQMGCWLFLSALVKVSPEAADALPHLVSQIDAL